MLAIESKQRALWNVAHVRPRRFGDSNKVAPARHAVTAMQQGDIADDAWFIPAQVVSNFASLREGAMGVKWRDHDKKFTVTILKVSSC